MAVTAAQLEVVFQERGSKQVVGAMNEVGGAVESSSDRFSQFYDDIKSGASGAADAVLDVVDAIGKISLVGGAALFGKAAKAAWDQVSAVEQASFALGAYGDSIEDVNAVLQDLTEYAKDASRSGGIFWSEQLYGAAQGLVTVGASLQDVAGYVEILSRSVGVSNATFDDLVRIVGRVASAGRITTNELELLRQAGFRLDDSFKNVNITWEELFAALDQGLPAEALLGQAGTIQGALLYLQGALINVGQAFLGVNEDLEFAAGGLGDRIFNSLSMAREGLLGLESLAAGVGTVLAQAFGVATEAMSILSDAMSGLATGFQALPGEMQTILIGLAGLTVAFGMFRQGLAATRTAIRLLGLGGLTRLLTPLGLAITGVVAVGGLLINSFMEQKQAAEAYRASVSDLEMTLEMLRRQGDTVLADMGENLMKTVNDLDTAMDELIATMYPTADEFFGQKFQEEMGHAFDPTNWADTEAMRSIRQAYADEFQAIVVAADEATAGLSISADEMTAINLKLLDALEDPNINAQAWIEWASSLLTGAENAEELRAAVDLIIETPLSEWARGATEDVTRLGMSLEQFDKQLSTALDTARDEADGVNTLNEALGVLTSGLEDGSIGLAEFESQLAEIDRRYADALLIVGPDLAAAQREADLIALARGYDEANASAEMFGNIGSSAFDAVAEASAQAHEEQLEWLETQREWIAAMMEVAGVADSLSQLVLSGHASDAAELANNLNDAAAAADAVFRVIVGNTDAIKSNADATLDWADNLIAVRGEYSRLDDLVKAGLITGTSGVFDDGSQYAEAQNAYDSIAESVQQIHDNLDAVQAIQAPLIAQMTAQTAGFTEELRNQSAEQQLITLGWMDAANASKAMEINTLAAAVAAGELGANGEQAFTSMIDGIMRADPVLGRMLEDLGLIDEVVRDQDGRVISYEVNLEGAEGAQSDIDRLNTSIVDLIDVLDDGKLNQSYTMRVDADVSGARAEIDSLGADPITVQVNPVLASGVDFVGGGVSDALSWAGFGGGGSETMTVNVIDNASGPLADVQAAADAIPRSIDIAISDTGGTHLVAAENLRTLQDLATTLDSTSIDVGVTDAGGTHNVAATNLRTLIDLSTELDGINPSIEVSVPGAEAAIGTLHAIRNAADAIPRDIGVTVSVSTIGGFASGVALGNSVAAGARAALGISSPSDEFEEIGKWSAIGFSDGFEKHHHEPYIGFSTDTPNYGAGFGGGGGGSAPVITNHITVNAETDADADEIAHTVAERIESALTNAVHQRRAGFGGVALGS